MVYKIIRIMQKNEKVIRLTLKLGEKILNFGIRAINKIKNYVFRNNADKVSIICSEEL